jgi:hypothetical protein
MKSFDFVNGWRLKEGKYSQMKKYLDQVIRQLTQKIKKKQEKMVEISKTYKSKKGLTSEEESNKKRLAKIIELRLEENA